MAFIVSFLTYMCNKVLPSGIYPMRLKWTQLSPIFKKGTSLKCQITGQYLYLHFPKCSSYLQKNAIPYTQ